MLRDEEGDHVEAIICDGMVWVFSFLAGCIAARNSLHTHSASFGEGMRSVAVTAVVFSGSRGSGGVWPWFC